MAARLLEHLHQEHKNLGRFLYCFRYQLRGFGDPDQDVNINLIMDMLDYINTYPERYHHPVEDVIFRYLLNNREFEEKKVIEDIIAAHSQLEEMTNKLKSDFSAVAMDIAMPMDKLRHDAHRYLEDQIIHLDIEETEVYPLVDEYLDEDDWAEIEATVETLSEDPVFDNTLREYQSLFQEITSFEAQGLDEKMKQDFSEE